MAETATGQAYQTMNLWQRTNDRLSRAKTIRDQFDGARDIITEYYRPDLTTLYKDKGRMFVSSNVVNGDPAYHAIVMTRGVLSGMVSASQPWRAFQPEEEHLQGDNEIRAWCQQLDNIMRDAYTDRDSTFYPSLYRYFLSDFTIGSPPMIVEYHNGRIVYTVPHHKQYWLIRDYFGEVTGLALVYDLPALEIERDFAGSEHLFPMALTKAMNSGNHYEDFEVVQTFFRTDDPIFRNRPGEDVEVMRHRPWVCTWQLANTDFGKQEPLRIRYYGHYDPQGRPLSRPFVVGDWDLNPNEAYSRTPAWHAIADAKGGQAAWKSTLQLAELKARPPLWALAKLAAGLKRTPGAVNEVPEKHFQHQPFAFGHEGDYLSSVDIWERITRSGERWFFVNHFLQLSAMVERKQAPPTATQVIDMGAEKLDQLSGGIQGIENGTLWPIDDRIFEILYYDGQIPAPPDKYLWEGSGILVPRFQGPLSQAMRLNTMLRRVNTGLSVCGPLFTLDDMAILKLKIPELVERIMEEVGIWQDTIRDKREYEDIVASMLEQQERQAAIAEGKAKAETMKALSGKTERTSPLAQLVKQ